MILLSIIAMGGVLSPLGILFVVEEVFLFIWHILQWVLFLDFFSGEIDVIGRFSVAWTKFFCWVIFVCVFICILLELLGWIIGFAVGGGKGVSTNKEGKQIASVDSEDVDLDVARSGAELDQKIMTYNVMKNKTNKKEH